MMMMMTMMTKKRSNHLAGRLLVPLGCLLLAAIVSAAPSKRSAPPDSPAEPGQKRFEPYALLVGTVFYEESGFLVRGAHIDVRQKEGKKHWDSKTNEEGSFSIRVPAGRGVYVVQAQISGREPDRKEVQVENDERVDIVLHLKGK